METELAAVPREQKGKEAAKRLRGEGKIPAVLYGHGFKSVLLSIDERDFTTIERHHRGLHGLFNLKVEGSEEDEHIVLVKEIQRDPIKDNILHVDFQKIRKGEELTADVSLRFVGDPVGVKEGGILQHFLYEVTVQCLPKDLPEQIEVDVSNLNIKDNLRISDLIQLEGVKYVNSPEEIVTAVAPKRVREVSALIGEEGITEEELAEMVERGEITAEEAAAAVEEGMVEAEEEKEEGEETEEETTE
ncbi:MAG: 50S ribosomal protein L25 [Actinomycetota bacterium]|nr:50S ribosomal protein L25 [Actinomycetota bacterium]